MKELKRVKTRYAEFILFKTDCNNFYVEIRDAITGFKKESFNSLESAKSFIKRLTGKEVK